MISLIQTAEGALNETHAILQRMRELAVQSANDTNTPEDRAELQKEVNQLANALNDIAADTEFNTQGLLDGTFKATFHVGANKGQNLTVAIDPMDAGSLGVSAFLEAGKATVAGQANIDVLKDASGNVVAAKAENGNYYAIDDVEANASDEIVPKDGVAEIETSPAYTLEGHAGILTKGTAEIEGVETADALLNAMGEAVAVEIGGKYYAVDNVEEDSENAGQLVAKDSTIELNVTEGRITSNAGIDISTQKTADNAITTIQTAIDTVSAERSKLGAVQNRLEHTINNLGASAENLTAAESRIRDVDMAKEMMEFTKNNILTQAAQAMLAQANQTPQGVLQLLR